MSAAAPAPVTGWRRWGAYLALTLVFALACGMLSWWQWARRAETVDRVQLVERNYDTEPRPVDEVLPALDAWDPEAEWRPVVLRGEYLADEELLVRNRVRAARAGFEQLVPLRLDDGAVLLVNRGWIPSADTVDGAPGTTPAPPEGEVTVIVRLRPAEPELPGRTVPEGQLSSIDVPGVVEHLGGEGYTAVYGVLASEDPPGELPQPLERPVDDEGPHLSYALQWIAFGVLAFIGLAWAWRRERRIASLPEAEQAAARAPRRGHADADAEDAILDSSGG